MNTPPSPPTPASPASGSTIPAGELARLYAVLTATNEAILRADTPDDMYQRVCEAAVLDTLFSSAAVFRPTPGGDELSAVAVAGLGKRRLGAMRPALGDDLSRIGHLGLAVLHRRSMVSHDVQDDPATARWAPLVADTGLRSMAAVPLLRGDTACGVLLLLSGEAALFDAPTVALLERIAANIVFWLEQHERKLERERFAGELERFRAVLDIAADELYLTDRETMRFVDVNATACAANGLTREALLALGPADFAFEDGRRLEDVCDAVIAAGGAGVTAEEVRVGPDGARYVIEVHRRAQRVGERWIIVTSARDISQRRRAEQLLKLEHSLALAIAHTPGPNRLLQAVIREICVCEGWDSGGYFRIVDDDGASVMTAGWAQPSMHEQATRHLQQRMHGHVQAGGLVSRVFKSREPLWLADSRREATSWPERFRGAGEQAHFSFPVWVDDRIIGVLAFASVRMREPDERLLQAVRVIGIQVGQALQRRLSEKVLRDSEQRFRSLTALSSDWYWEQDREFRFVRIGSGDENAAPVGFASSEGLTAWSLPGVVATSANFDDLRQRMSRGERFRDFEFALKDAHGGERWTSLSGEPIVDASGERVGYRGIARDISERKLNEARIRHLATHDTLTSLPNRAMFSELLAHAIHVARRYESRFAVLFIDLDRFKLINDTLGHAAGDALLQEMALRLKACLRTSDVVARLGGDEFVVLVQNVHTAEEVAVVARKLLAAAAQPMMIGAQECRVTASVGICTYPADARDEQALMRGADIAMYRAKQEGKNTFQFFAQEHRSESLERLRMETALRRALESGEFALHYQPKVDLQSGDIVGAEALLRWRSAELGAVSPADFIPLAEETGLIVPIGKWVLATACAQARQWRREGLPALNIAVNLSARQFADEMLLDDLDTVLRETGLEASCLELEITESLMVHNPERARTLLGAIRALGVRLTVDDFGTGYSSLGQLKRFPIDTLKIDRSFIRELPHDVGDAAITEAIIAMSRTLGLTVVAEGVERDDQRVYLRQRGCDQIQGFLVSRPVPPEEFAAFWRARHGTVSPVTG